MQANQKSILITGSATGIGYASARFLRDKGWRVFASCRQLADCERLREQGFEAPHLDYEDPATIASAVEEVLSATGGTLDALYNNGAYAVPGLVEDLPVDALKAQFQVNLFGWHDLTCRLIPTFRAQGHGRIVQCSSVLGFIHYPWRGAYIASKFALEGLTDTLRVEMKGSGIEVVLIQPGPITSEFRKNAIRHFEKWIEPTKTARAADYEAQREQVYGRIEKARFELPPEAVAEKLLRALTDPNPAPRYRVTTPTYISTIMKRLLRTRTVDKIVGKQA